MLEKLNLIFEWSEVWALFIPLLVLRFRRNQPAYLRPVIIYLWIALFLNLTGNSIAQFKEYYTGGIRSNNPLYNIHSLVRFVCFCYFFRLLDAHFRGTFNRIINLAAILLIAINFIFIEDFANPRHLSGNLLAAEAFVLLVFCMQYYLYQLQVETSEYMKKKDFWVATGLSIYVVINFFVFLFYVPLLSENPELSDKMWGIHNLGYIVLCIFIAKAFYEPA
jgi:hypothetical protein